MVIGAARSRRVAITVACAAALLSGALGCRSHFISAAIVNESSETVRVVELDYPGASFGVSTLAPHARYSYRFKLLGSGPLALTYTDAKGTAHSSNGPQVQEGQQGGLTVRIGKTGLVEWSPALTTP